MHEWRAAIARDYDAFFQKMLGVDKLADRHYRDIKITLHKILNKSSDNSESPKLNLSSQIFRLAFFQN